MKNLIILLLTLISSISGFCQSAWPSVSWANSSNISSVLSNSVVELSGLYWNNDLKRLLAVGDAGHFVALQYNGNISKFSLLGTTSNSDGPEGITQVNTSGNEFYTIDENSYEIRKYTFNSNFTGVTKLNSWNLLASPSPMTNTDNTGPEGITFVPDSYLQKIGFVSSATGAVYTSKKGMGGLLFLAHQNGGYVWVYDVNPNVNNDFLYVGKYKTNRSESCDLAFDNSTGLLYILHNTDGNTLEVTDLKTTLSGETYTLSKLKEYSIPNPSSGSDNIEGFAISPKYPQVSTLGVWLCRDVTSTTEKADALRWFNPYAADGNSIETSLPNVSESLNFRLIKTSTGFDIQFDVTPVSDIYLYSINGILLHEFKPDNKISFEIKYGFYILKCGNFAQKITFS
jgi:hypothetical protein